METGKPREVAVLADVSNVVVVTDGLRAWGFAAAIAGIPQATRVLAGVAAGNREEVRLGPWAGLGLLCFFLFLLIAGFTIPLSNRVFDGQTPPVVALIFWTFASTSGWLLNAALAPGKAWTFAGAGILLPAAIVASALTYAP